MRRASERQAVMPDGGTGVVAVPPPAVVSCFRRRTGPRWCRRASEPIVDVVRRPDEAVADACIQPAPVGEIDEQVGLRLRDEERVAPERAAVAQRRRRPAGTVVPMVPAEMDVVMRHHDRRVAAIPDRVADWHGGFSAADQRTRAKANPPIRAGHPLEHEPAVGHFRPVVSVGQPGTRRRRRGTSDW